MKQRNTRRGFTLIELLVVVLIIGILVAVALPQYNKAVEKSRLTEALLYINTMEKAIDAYILQAGSVPDEAADIDTSGVLDIEVPLKNFGANWACYGQECYSEIDPRPHYAYQLKAERRNNGVWYHECDIFDTKGEPICNLLKSKGWRVFDERG